MKAISMNYSELLERCWDRVMVTMSSEYSIYLYREKVDLRKGISGLSGIVRSEMKMNPNTAKSIYVFSGSNPRIKKILVREHNRFELTQIRLDSGKFFQAYNGRKSSIWENLLVRSCYAHRGFCMRKYKDKVR